MGIAGGAGGRADVGKAGAGGADKGGVDNDGVTGRFAPDEGNAPPVFVPARGPA